MTRCVYELTFAILVVFVLTGNVSYALDCFECLNVTDPSLCHPTTCSSNQRCYHTVKNNGTEALHSKGCIDSTQCSFRNTVPTFIGKRSVRRKRSPECFECCSADFCNSKSCEYDTSCVDDSNTDCARIHSLFNVCNDTHHAKLLCRKFCGYCNLVDGDWASWGSFSACSASCGNGFETRTRTCNNPAPSNGGLTCVGNSSEQQSCNLKPCIIDGQWTAWGGWTTCSTTCGDGMSLRNRNCTNPSPANEGLNCQGNSTEQRQCLLAKCPVNGNWSNWTDWSTCSVTCGIGMISRHRHCDNPRPGPLGASCDGDSVEYNICMITACAIIGFNARMSSSNTPTAGQTVPFTTEETDVGNGYDPSTSTYTVPVTGVYDFTWSLHVNSEGIYWTELVINNNVVDVQYLNSRTHDGSYVEQRYATTTKVVRVQKGDRVFIRLHAKSSTAYVWSNQSGYSTFSGWMRH